LAGLEEGKMKQVIVKTATEADFFQRGREIARLADRAEALPEECVISFEDPADLLKLLTTARLNLLQKIKEQPGSITQLAQRLHRNRSTVKRDVEMLARYGLVAVESTVSSRQTWVEEIHPRVGRLRLEASIG
jgi:predicted transcriptional regulator